MAHLDTARTAGSEQVFVVLSIDGGGVRGYLPALVLAEIEKRTGLAIAQQFDLVAGTSTGALLTLGLTTPDDKNPSKPKNSAARIAQFYKEKSEEIFPNPKLNIAKQMTGTKYSNKKLKEQCDALFGNTTTDQLLAPILIPSIIISRSLPADNANPVAKTQFQSYFFKHRPKLARGSKDLVFKVTDVALGATAAPTYLAAEAITPLRHRDGTKWQGSPFIIADGGLGANNPAQCALMESVKFREGLGFAENARVIMLSLGTGDDPKTIDPKTLDNGGILSWANPANGVPFLKANSTMTSDVANTMCSMVLGNDFYRFNYVSKDIEGLDDSSNKHLQALEEGAKAIIASPRFNQFCEMLKAINTNKPMPVYDNSKQGRIVLPTPNAYHPG